MGRKCRHKAVITPQGHKSRSLHSDFRLNGILVVLDAIFYGYLLKKLRHRWFHSIFTLFFTLPLLSTFGIVIKF